MMNKTSLHDIDGSHSISIGSCEMSAPPPDGPARRQSWQERYDAGQYSQDDRRAMWRDFDNSWVMVSELVGATLTWGGIGWLADRWLNLAPVLMSVGFVLGFATGFYLLWARSTGRIDRGHAPAALSDHDTEGRA
ncbi:hypothetical protein BH24ACT15_BH24ACT15_21080 [soil metagenome]